MASEAALPESRLQNLRSWLLSDSPESVFHARCQRFYLGWVAFRANPIAMIGLLIIVGPAATQRAALVRHRRARP